MENITLVDIPDPSKSTPTVSCPTIAQPMAAQVPMVDSKPQRVAMKNGGEPSVNSLVVKLLSAGTAGCIADIVTFPLDTAKVRLQIQGEGAARGAAGPVYRGIFGTLLTMAKTEGIPSWYSGLPAGLLRQMFFSSIRIGLYDPLTQVLTDTFQPSSDASKFGIRVLAALTTGGLSVVIAQPTDVVKVRFQAQGRRKAVRYHGVYHAFSSITATEGIKGLWKGAPPNIARTSIVNVTELVSYYFFKEAILSRQLLTDSMPCHVASAFGAGLVTTLLASPVDVVKTRFMNSSSGQYSGAIDCACKMIRSEGFPALYKGFMPSFVRLGSWNVVMFVAYEQIKRLTHMVASTHMVATDNQNNNNANVIDALA